MANNSALANGPLPDALAIFLTYVQPWLNLIALVENALIVIAFVVFVTSPRRGVSNQSGGAFGGGRELAIVSRLYYTLIALAEFVLSLFGVVLRDTLYFMPIWISLLLMLNLMGIDIFMYLFLQVVGKVVMDLYHANDFMCKLIPVMWLAPCML